MSDLCRFIDNAYTDAAPYQAHVIIQNSNPDTVAAFQAAFPNGREGLSPVQAVFTYLQDTVSVLIDRLPAVLDTTVASANQSNSTVIDACGNRVSYIWVTYMILAGPVTPISPTAEAIRARRFIVGFEMPDVECPAGGSLIGNGVGRHASRVPGGMGMSIRSNVNQFIQQPVMIWSGGGTSTFKSSWERFYIRPLAFDASSRVIWRCYATTVTNRGISVSVLPSGLMQIFEIDSVNVSTLRTTSSAAIPSSRWSRIDIVVAYGTGGATSGSFRLWLNGVLVVDILSSLADGLGGNNNHQQTELGTVDTTHTLEIDIDDWINAEPPVLFNGLDWLSGSHVRLIRPQGDGAGRANWTGDWRVAEQLPTLTSGQAITSTTSGARLELTADANTVEPLGDYQQGVVALVGGVNKNSAGAGNGQVGFSITGGADILTAVPELGSFAWRGMAHLPSGLTTPLTLAAMNLLYVKAATVTQVEVRALQAVAECVGAWGVEDQPAGVAPLPDSGIHNGPYWEHGHVRGAAGAPPFGEVIIESGVYTGNGTGQDLPKTGPGHWLFVRRASGAGSGRNTWFSSMIGAHISTNGASGMQSENMVQSLIDASNAAMMRVAGADPEGNESGILYQWVLVSDVGMRFLLCGSLAHNSPQTVAANNLLADPTFFAEAGFFFVEVIATGGGTNAFWYKGIGHAPTNAQQVAAAETTAVAQFGLGSIVTQTALHTASNKAAYALFRQFDGPGTPGGPATSGCDPDTPSPGVVVALMSYVGNGAGGTRNITVGLNGRRPLFAIVTPHNGFARFRDPSHVGLDSGRVDSGFTTGTNTDIVGGTVDQISVGVSLNANGIIYDVFVLPGEQGGSGWSPNGTFFPVPPSEPCGGQWPPNPTPPEPPTPPGAACPVGSFPTDLT